MHGRTPSLPERLGARNRNPPKTICEYESMFVTQKMQFGFDFDASMMMLLVRDVDLGR
jgi:hypothetical protein